MKSYSILVSAIIALLVGIAAEAKYSGGTGEPNDPYRIATAENLNDIGNHQEDWDKHFILVNDVNLAQYTGTKFKIIGNSTTNFTGVFDGNDHRVWSFTWSSTGRNFIGLFGYLSNGGQVKNLGMENVDVNAVNGYDVGGLVGINGNLITDCYSTGSVSGGDCVGGMVGYNYSGTVTACYATGSVRGDSHIGGLVGTNLSFGWSVQITNCYSTGSVVGNYYVGGLVGDNDDWIADCYSTGNVSGTAFVGGLVG